MALRVHVVFDLRLLYHRLEFGQLFHILGIRNEVEFVAFGHEQPPLVIVSGYHDFGDRLCWFWDEPYGICY